MSALQSQSYHAGFRDTDDGFRLVIQQGKDECSVSVRISDPSFRLHLQQLAPTLAVDVLDIGFAIQAVDRMCPRRSRSRFQSYGYWARDICVTLPVRNPSLWNQIEIRHKLSLLLRFV